MPVMKNATTSDCSFDEPANYAIKDEIDTIVTRLKFVIEEEASLRKSLHDLFARRQKEALDQVKQANIHLDLVNDQEKEICDMLKEVSTTANTGPGGSVYSRGAKGDAEPRVTPIAIGSADPEEEARKAEQALFGHFGEKAEKPDCITSGKKKDKDAKRNGTNTKPTYHALSPTEERPHMLDHCSDPKSPPGPEEEDAQAAVEDDFAAFLTKKKKGTTLKATIPKKSIKSRIPNSIDISD